MKTENKKLKIKPGFTLAELLMAMMVMGIILSAVVSLAYALGSANEATSQMGRKQTQLRSATVRLTELIRHSKLICAISVDNIVIWKKDENNDNRINPREIVFIESGDGHDYIRILDFSPGSDAALQVQFEDTVIIIGDFDNSGAKDTLTASFNENYINLIPECSNVQFRPDRAAPFTRFISISFDLEDSGVMQNYQINASLRASGINLLDSGGQLVAGDDD